MAPQEALVPRQASGGGAGGASRAKRSGGGGLVGLVGALASGVAARVEALGRAAEELADRSNPRSKSYQDAAFHAALFAGAVYAMHKYGHLLSV